MIKGLRVTNAETIMTAALHEDIIPISSNMDVISITNMTLEHIKLKPPVPLTEDSDEIYRIQGKIEIQNESKNLKVMIVVHGHCREKGNRKYAATLGLIAKESWWEGMKADIKEFIHSCIYCIISRNSEQISRPASTALHGERPNEGVHADLIYMGPD